MVVVSSTSSAAEEGGRGSRRRADTKSEVETVMRSRPCQKRGCKTGLDTAYENRQQQSKIRGLEGCQVGRLGDGIGLNHQKNRAEVGLGKGRRRY